jgi:hypothetical protein
MVDMVLTGKYIKVSPQLDAGKLFKESGTGILEFLFSLCILGGNCKAPRVLNEGPQGVPTT